MIKVIQITDVAPPIPTRARILSKYGFDTIPVGGYGEFEGEPRRVMSAAHRWATNHGAVFVVRTLANGNIGVWRRA